MKCNNNKDDNNGNNAKTKHKRKKHKMGHKEIKDTHKHILLCNNLEL